MSTIQPVALTIAGSDPSGGAGLQADLKTFHQQHVYGMSAVTLLTIQNTQTVAAVEILKPEFVRQQIEACLEDIPPQAIKTGALGDGPMIQMVAELAPQFGCPLIVDPVMISKHNVPLLQQAAIETMVNHLLPVSFLVTPNLSEAELLSGVKIDSRESLLAAAREIQHRGAANVLIKGGHRFASQLAGEEKDWAIDVLLTDRVTEYRRQRIETVHTHGTGCVFSAAITAGLAKSMLLHEAIHLAKEFISKAIKTNPGLGRGYGPVNLFA